MFHSRQLTRLIGVLAFSAFALGAGWARAAVLTPDPDFGAQTLGNPIGSPWFEVSGGGNVASASAQSPFTNVFPNNGKGANTPASAGNPYFVGRFSNATPPAADIPASATGLLYFNADFRNNSTEGGDYSMVITRDANGAPTVRTVALYVTGNALYAEGYGGVGRPILSLTPGTWYNVQLTLDMTNNAYSGTVAQFGGATTAIPSRFFISESPINCIYSDGGTNLFGGTAPNHDIDNFALADTPFAPAPPPLSRLTVGQIVNIDFNGFRPGDVMGPTYVGSGAAGGGSVFNGIPVDSTGGNDNLTVTASNLLDANGIPTRIGFTVSPVGGDNAVGSPAPTSSSALFGDYIFDHSAGNNSDSPFTITFLDPAVSADLYFYINGINRVTVDGAIPAPFTSSGIFTSGINGNTAFFANVPIVNGQITGHFGNELAVIGGMTVVTYVPEPATGVLLLVGAVGMPWLWRVRRRAARSAASS